MNLRPKPLGRLRPRRHRLLPVVAAGLLCCGASLLAQPDKKPAGKPESASPQAQPRSVAAAASAALVTSGSDGDGDGGSNYCGGGFISGDKR